MHHRQLFDKLFTVLLVLTSLVGASKWSDAGHTISVRVAHAASSLNNGKILFTGGYGYRYCMTTEFYYPSSGKWTDGTYMNDCRYYHTATLLDNGQVLIAGGFVEDPERVKNISDVLDGSELFDPDEGSWTRTGSLHQRRHTHTASLLPNGKLLVVGGLYSNFLNSAELYDPSTGNWTIAASMQSGRAWHTATTLANGKVLMAGGIGDGNNGFRTVELYDPSIDKWSNISSMNYPRYGHTATVLQNGKILFAGGIENPSNALNSSELFDPLTETWTKVGSMSTGRAKHTASLLNDGKVLVAGGGTMDDIIPGGNPVNTAEIFDPSTGKWTKTDNMHYTRTWHTATVLDNGNVIVVGGNMDDESSAFTPELYNSLAGIH